jgi:hypothetical protein
MAIWEQPDILSGIVNTQTGTQPKPEIAICILHTGTVTTEWAIRTALVFMHMQNMKKNFTYLCNRNMPYDVAREQTTRMALDAGAKWIFHLDSDLLIPVNTIEVLIQWAEKFNLPLLSGLYWAKKPTIMPAAWLAVNEDPQNNKVEFAPLDMAPHKDTQNIIPVDVVGAGCLLINADLLRKLDQSNPNLSFFQWGVGRKDKDGKNLPQMSEDFYLCWRCQKELGMRPHLATAVKCDHITTVAKRGQDGQYEFMDKI